MKKGATRRAREATAGQEGTCRLVGVGGVLVRAGEALRELVMATGLAVFETMLEEDREALCGPAGSWQGSQRRAYRYGHEQGRVVLGGRKVQLSRPRVRSVGGEELALPSWVAMRQEDPLHERALEQMVVGVSTRNLLGCRGEGRLDQRRRLGHGFCSLGVSSCGVPGGHP